MKKSVLLLLALTVALCTGKAMADGFTNYVSAGGLVYTAHSSVSQADITNTTAALATISTTITLAAPSTHVQIKTSTGASPIFVDLSDGTATSGDYQQCWHDPPLVYDGQAISEFKYIAEAPGTGTISVTAW